MRMNRRNVLIGVGAVVAGGGAALGTGAFSQVEAQRDVTVETTDDADALLGIEVNDDYGDVEDGVVSINLSDGNLDNAEGLNPDAETTFGDILTITNNGNNNVTVDISVEEDDGLAELSFDPSNFSLDSGGNSEDIDMTVETPAGTTTFNAEILIDASQN